MKTLIIIILFYSPLLISCWPKKPLAPETKLWLAAEDLANEKNEARDLINKARELYWPDKPQLKQVLQINAETVECADKHRLSNDFFRHLHDNNRVEPDSSLFLKMEKAYRGATACFKKHNEQIKKSLKTTLFHKTM